MDDEVGESPWGRRNRERSTVYSVGRFFLFLGEEVASRLVLLPIHSVSDSFTRSFLRY